MQVTEDFLQEEYYDHLNEIITSTQFPWMFQKRVANIGEDPEEQSQFDVTDEDGQKEFTTVKLFRDDIEDLL